MKKTSLIITAATVTLLTAGIASARDSVSFSVSIGVPAPVYAPRQVVYVPQPVEYRVVERHMGYPTRHVETERDNCTKVVKKVYVNDRFVERRVKKVRYVDYNSGNSHYGHDHQRDDRSYRRDHDDDDRSRRDDRRDQGRNRW